MKDTFQTIPLTEEHLKLYDTPRIIVVRLYCFPHFLYAAILENRQLEGDCLSLQFKSSIRFEREGREGIWLPHDSLVRIQTDHGVTGTENSVSSFTLQDVCAIQHKLFSVSGEETGIIGLQHREGFAHLSYRGADVISVEKIITKPH